jgi:eukaryotic translation initiation factor 2C
MISKYRACVRTQGAKVEMIDNLFKPVSDDVDEGIIRFAYFNSLKLI